MLWLLPAAGALLGAVANKKNPMKGALLGAGLGATGGLLAPAAMGAAGATGAAGAAGAGAAAGDVGMMYAGADAASAATLGGGATVNGGNALGGGLLGTLGKYAKPASQGLELASGLMGGREQPVQASPFIQQPTTGNQTLATLAQQGDPQETLAQADKMRRQRRMGLLGRVA